ncbi:co-chaperone DjlA [Flocculibacter collagenilyticus]|uniref:co-chaperone DjlA n=1 Tax=Flocculibacter collagenilyticus TaxID=2744479 RepID=UPI0018F2B8C0|nr:co-chaperone DjlA [Flocculibacter collagenilyticus]
MWGKVLGAFFGFLFGKWFGALLGLYLGHLFDKGMKNDFDRAGGFSRLFHFDENEKQAIFFYNTFAVMGHLAKATGRVTELHIKAATVLMDSMNLQGEQREEAQQAFREGKLAGFPLVKHLKEFKYNFAGRRDLVQLFLEIQVQVAFCDGVIQREEADILKEIAHQLNFSSGELEQIIRRWQAEYRFHQEQQAASSRRQHSHRQSSHSSQQGSFNQRSSHHQSSQQERANNYSQSGYASQAAIESAYKILGLNKSCSDKELKRAYRKLIAEHHPDKLVSKGLPKQMMEIAKQKTQDIQSAYELIKSHR